MKKITEACSTMWIWIVVGLLLLLFTAAWWLGNQLVNFALVMQGETTGRTERFGTSAAGREKTPHQETVRRRRAEERQRTETWLQQIKAEQVALVGEDRCPLAGMLYFCNNPGKRWVILVHGYSGNGEEMLDFARHYMQQGYHVLTPDLRGQGKSGGKLIGMGWPDRLDLLQWMHYLIERFGSEIQIVLHGHSMGAATVMMAAGERLPEQVKAAVEDCGYTSVWDIFADQLQKLFHLKPFPVLYLAAWALRLRGGYDMRKASALEQIKKCEIPMLFIHGAEDEFVPVRMVYPLYEAANCSKKLLIVSEAEHADSKETDPQLYYDTVFSFLKYYI